MLEIQKSTDVPKGKQPTKEAPKQYMWKEGDSERFTEALCTPEFDEILTEILNANPANPNSIVNPLTEALLKAAEKAGVKERLTLEVFPQLILRGLILPANKLKTLSSQWRKM